MGMACLSSVAAERPCCAPPCKMARTYGNVEDCHAARLYHHPVSRSGRQVGKLIRVKESGAFYLIATAGRLFGKWAMWLTLLSLGPGTSAGKLL